MLRLVGLQFDARPVPAAPTMGFWGLANGTPGGAGTGSLALPFAIPNAPFLHQQRISFQGFALDANAADGFASTAGLTSIIL